MHHITVQCDASSQSTPIHSCFLLGPYTYVSLIGISCWSTCNTLIAICNNANYEMIVRDNQEYVMLINTIMLFSRTQFCISLAHFSLFSPVPWHKIDRTNQWIFINGSTWHGLSSIYFSTVTSGSGGIYLWYGIRGIIHWILFSYASLQHHSHMAYVYQHGQEYFQANGWCQMNINDCEWICLRNNSRAFYAAMYLLWPHAIWSMCITHSIIHYVQSWWPLLP